MTQQERRVGRRLPAGVLVAFAALCGCLQVEVTVQMRDDGGATVIERVRFSRRLRELDAGTPPEKKLIRLLDRAAVDARARQMGKGCRVVRHTVSDLRDGGRESVAVYDIPHIEDLRLINPYLHDAPPGRVMRFVFQPIYRRVHSYHRVGDLMMYLVPAQRPRRRRGKPAPPPPPPTPVELQVLRDLRPVFADLAKGIELKLRLVATRPIAVGAIRNRQSASKVITLFSFTDKDLDAHGRRWVENEELMLSMLRFRMNAENIVRHSSGFPANLTLPVFRGGRPYASTRFRIRPTRALFMKYFHGRPKSQGGDR